MEFISSIVSYILLTAADLQDGETIGLSKKDKHKITLSRGIALPEQDTLKITYEAETKNLGVGNRETIWTDYLNF